jgi:hypothetical protein
MSFEMICRQNEATDRNHRTIDERIATIGKKCTPCICNTRRRQQQRRIIYAFSLLSTTKSPPMIEKSTLSSLSLSLSLENTSKLDRLDFVVVAFIDSSTRHTAIISFIIVRWFSRSISDDRRHDVFRSLSRQFDRVQRICHRVIVTCPVRWDARRTILFVDCLPSDSMIDLMFWKNISFASLFDIERDWSLSVSLMCFFSLDCSW